MKSSQQSIDPEKEKACNVIFPNIHISSSVTAPTEMAFFRKNVGMVGGGSGIAPFLAFLDDKKIHAHKIRDGE